MYPIRFEPVYQHYIWGGGRIPKLFARALLPGVYAESWEIADRSDGMSIAANGPWKGKSLRALCLEKGEALWGKGRAFASFPLLIKIIDAKENLSIQVHPDASSAARMQAEAKTEMWIALAKSTVLAGWKKAVSPEQWKKAVEEQRAEKLLKRFVLERGETLFVPAGEVHAILAGSLLLEIQQNSNTTYRLYDWGRVGRELHLDPGLASIHWDVSKKGRGIPKVLEKTREYERELLQECPYFSVERVRVKTQWNLERNAKSFEILFCMGGKGNLEVDGAWEPFSYGMTYLVAAAAQTAHLEGACEAIRIFLPP